MLRSLLMYRGSFWRRSNPVRASTSAVITLILACAVWPAVKLPGWDTASDAWAGEDEAGRAAERECFLADSERRLIDCRIRIADVGNALLAGSEAPTRIRVALTDQELALRAADAEFQDAQLSRKTAEIALREYEESNARQDEATIELELRLAESEALLSRDAIDDAKERLANVKRSSKGTPADLAVVYSYEDQLAIAVRRESRAKLAVEDVRFSLGFQQRHTKLIRIKKLQADAESARADELGKKAECDGSRWKVKRLEQSIKQRSGRGAEQGRLDSLKAAIGIEDEVRTELGKIKASGTLDQGSRMSATALMTKLEGVLNRLEEKAAEMQVEELRDKIKELAQPASTSEP